MKKKIFEKILAIGSSIVALVFVIVLLVTMFGGIDAAQFDNQLVQGLFVTLGVVFVLTAIGTIIYLFVDTDAVKEILINSDKQTSTKATASVIKSLAKKNVATIEGVKCTKVTILLTEYGVRLKLGIKIVDKDVQAVSALLKCLLEDVYAETLGYRFYAIDFKVLSLKTAYSADMASVEEKAKETLEVMKEESDKAFEEAHKNEDEALGLAKETAKISEEAVEETVLEKTEIKAEKEVEEKVETLDEKTENKTEEENADDKPEEIKAEDKPEEKVDEE